MQNSEIKTFTLSELDDELLELFLVRSSQPDSADIRKIDAEIQRVQSELRKRRHERLPLADVR